MENMLQLSFLLLYIMYWGFRLLMLGAASFRGYVQHLMQSDSPQSELWVLLCFDGVWSISLMARWCKFTVNFTKEMKFSLALWHRFVHRHFAQVSSKLRVWTLGFTSRSFAVSPFFPGEASQNSPLLHKTPGSQNITLLSLCHDETAGMSGFAEVRRASYSVLVLHTILESV